MKIVICGSMTAAREIVVVEEKLKEHGHEVVLPAFTHEYAALDTPDAMHAESAKNKIEHDLIRGYFEKIKDSDAILVVNIERKGVRGYIGGNSFLEMGFAHVLNKPVYLLYDIPEVGYQDEIKAMEPILLGGDVSLIA